MATLVETPVDVVKLLVNYLKATASVTALLPTDASGHKTVYGYVLLPEQPTYPLVALHRYGGTRLHPNGHLDGALVQVDVWGTPRTDVGSTQAIVGAVRVALTEPKVAGSHTEGTVAGLAELTGPQWLPDLVEGRVRFVWTVQVWTHP